MNFPYVSQEKVNGSPKGYTLYCRRSRHYSQRSNDLVQQPDRTFLRFLASHYDLGQTSSHRLRLARTSEKSMCDEMMANYCSPTTENRWNKKSSSSSSSSSLSLSSSSTSSSSLSSSLWLSPSSPPPPQSPMMVSSWRSTSVVAPVPLTSLGPLGG